MATTNGMELVLCDTGSSNAWTYCSLCVTGYAKHGVKADYLWQKHSETHWHNDGLFDWDHIMIEIFFYVST